MKKMVWVNPDKLLMETGHKTFDQQTNVISTGNIIAETQLARYIRGELEVTCWGDEVYKPGHLRDFDLGNFPWLSATVRAFIITHTNGTEDSVWVSQFFHYNGHRKIVHGYIVTTTDHKLLAKFITGPTYRSGLVINGVLPYVVEQEGSDKHG